jgi:hypothetical protein
LVFEENLSDYTFLEHFNAAIIFIRVDRLKSGDECVYHLRADNASWLQGCGVPLRRDCEEMAANNELDVILLVIRILA